MKGVIFVIICIALGLKANTLHAHQLNQTNTLVINSSHNSLERKNSTTNWTTSDGILCNNLP